MQKTTLAGPIVRLLVSPELLQSCNAGAIGKHLVDQLVKESIANQEFEPLLGELEAYLAVLHDKKNMRARDLAHEVERATADLVARIRRKNGDHFERGISQETNRARRRAALEFEEGLSHLDEGGVKPGSPEDWLELHP